MNIRKKLSSNKILKTISYYPLYYCMKMKKFGWNTHTHTNRHTYTHTHAYIVGFSVSHMAWFQSKLNQDPYKLETVFLNNCTPSQPLIIFRILLYAANWKCSVLSIH